MVSLAQRDLRDEKDKRNFEDAQKFAQRQGGNLITVTGADINDYLADNCRLEYVMFLYLISYCFKMWHFVMHCP